MKKVIISWMKSLKEKKLVLPIALILAAMIIGLVLFLILGNSGVVALTPAVTIETPAKMTANDHEPFSLELQLSTLKKERYPAASFSISFDSAKLEFLGIGEGNVLINNSESSSGTALPEWSVNVEQSNEVGVINILYLDMTGGRYAFSKELLQEKDNVILLLNFRLRGSVRKGDILELSLDDAVFAATDETKSLASISGTLKTANGRIVIGG